MQLKTILIIITIFLTTSPLLYSDSTNAKIDSTITEKVSQINVGEIILRTQASLDNHINPQKWYDKPLLITLIGSFLAAMVAVSIIFIVNHQNKRNTIRKQIRKYKSLLFGIYSELRNNDRIIDILVGKEKIDSQNIGDDNKGEVQIFLESVKNINKLIGVEVFTALQVRFIEQCRLNLIDNESFSLEVLEFTSRYIDRANSINNNLKSQKILEIQEFLPHGIELYDGAKIYFDEVEQGLRNLRIGGNKLRSIILTDANRFPKIDPHFENSTLDSEKQETGE